VVCGGGERWGRPLIELVEPPPPNEIAVNLKSDRDRRL